MTQQFHPRAYAPGLTYVDGHHRFVRGGRDLMGGSGCPSRGEGTGKMWSMCTVGCCAAVRADWMCTQ